jgi:hypothetical protein
MTSTTATATALDQSYAADRAIDLAFLNTSVLSGIDPRAFQAIKPFPFLEIEGLLTRDGHHALLRDLPDPTMFSQVFGRRRRYGQRSRNLFAFVHESASQPVSLRSGLGSIGRKEGIARPSCSSRVHFRLFRNPGRIYKMQE